MYVGVRALEVMREGVQSPKATITLKRKKRKRD